jgi:hypothetical protein
MKRLPETAFFADYLYFKLTIFVSSPYTMLKRLSKKTPLASSKKFLQKNAKISEKKEKIIFFEKKLNYITSK